VFVVPVSYDLIFWATNLGRNIGMVKWVIHKEMAEMRLKVFAVAFY
jgi:hypothetical protein